MTGPVARPLQMVDVGALVALEMISQPYPWTAGMFEDALSAGYGARGLFKGDALVAYILWMPTVDEAELLNLVVSPAWRRRGLGRSLLSWLCQAAAEHGARRLLLEVRAGNSHALALYQQAGFLEIGLRRGYYRDGSRREDARVLARDLERR